MDVGENLLREWEEEQRLKVFERLYGEEVDVFKGKCPRIAKVKDFRRVFRGSGNRFSDSKRSRRFYQKSVRGKLNKIPFKEEFYNVVARDYKTYGYLDW